MRLALPHSLGREEVRRRLQSRIGELGNHIPGGVAEVSHSWSGEDRMNLVVGVMGQQVAATIDVEEERVVLDVSLPGMLSFLEPAIKGAVESAGRKLLT